MQIIRLPALSDNYVFLLHDSQENTVAVVDPAEVEPILHQIETMGADLVAIFNTHHHYDHVGGNEKLIARFPKVVVYGGAADRGRIPGQQVFLQDGDRVQFANRTAEVLFVPGHTRAHIAYYFPPVIPHDTGELFCGDTLFAGGCGRLFEGTPAQMVSSLSKIRNLPDNTHVWCAHEYTLSNLKFAVTVDSENADLQKRFEEVKIQREKLNPTVPSLLGVEKLTNPFLRWEEPALQASAKSNDPIQTFTRIRGMKDNF
ncbi:hydroxyacylglutathione hydrolase [Anabaena sp. FACHB-1237]|uniref:hydroxyacylglutathione hydrolase n=1 Tax=Anabaena sp. FACHB-1237 TaxID=2692769 RepID=UPI001681109E|nr:hydroxyacylglutathione hydrolase [Anabaena sp. FACHB-1237]MBD2136672.1 hydroxyacylglutathione hydrolase [Anabaena sp. FACHB-1237]